MSSVKSPKERIGVPKRNHQTFFKTFVLLQYKVAAFPFQEVFPSSTHPCDGCNNNQPFASICKVKNCQLQWENPGNCCVFFFLKFCLFLMWAMKRPGFFRVFVGDEIRPSYMGIIMSHYKPSCIAKHNTNTHTNTILSVAKLNKTSTKRLALWKIHDLGQSDQMASHQINASADHLRYKRCG